MSLHLAAYIIVNFDSSDTTKRQHLFRISSISRLYIDDSCSFIILKLPHKTGQTHGGSRQAEFTHCSAPTCFID